MPKSKNEIAKERYERLKAQGKCPGCGKINDRPDKTYCTECKEKRTEQSRLNRDFYKANGLCSLCGKYKVFGDEKRCPECRAKEANYGSKKREKDREHIREYQRNRYHEKMQRCNENHLCTKCKAKLPNDYKYKRCEKCRQRINESNKKYNDKKKFETTELNKREVWKQQGLCLLCGAERYENFKLCEMHYKKAWEHLHSQKIVEARQNQARFQYKKVMYGN